MLSPHADLPPDLGAWRLEPARHPHFRQQVWARIDATRRTRAPWSLYLRTHAPAVLVALLVAVFAGAWTGQARARHRAALDRATVVAMYVRALDARAMTQR